MPSSAPRAPAASSVPTAPPPAWTPFRPLAHAPILTAATLAELLDGGQSFRWQRDPATDTWLGIWSDHIVRLRLNPSDNRLEWSAPTPLATRVATALPAYLFGHDTAAALDALPWRSDPHLARSLAAFPGLTILRQPFGETLLGFLCSATKQIVQIKQMVALLASRHGATILPPAPPAPPVALPSRTSSAPRPTANRPNPTCHLIGDKPLTASFLPPPSSLPPASSLPPSSPAASVASLALNRLPTWSELASVPEPDLRACLLGFRARYIHDTAQFIAARPGWLEETKHLPYALAKTRLCELPGVGEKVADCVLLFGAGKLEAFPVDTWIIKAMARRYALDGWSPSQIAHFGRVHFGPHAGLAQQYLFAYERAAKNTE